jgi:hypothetical protein
MQDAPGSRHDDPDHSDDELEQLRRTDELSAAQVAEHLEPVPDDEAPPVRRVRD